MFRQLAPLLFAALCAGSAQTVYDGPRPPKADVPYIKHASSLVATEAGEAKEQKVKNDTMYIVEGTASKVETPLASPIFIFQSDKIAAEKFGLYKFEVKGGHREIVFGPKKQPKGVR